MQNHFPDPAKEILHSGRRIGKEIKDKNGACWIDSGVNKVTGGLVAAGREAITFPLRALVFPTMKTVNDLAKSTVKGALNITWNAIKSIPWIPVPARNRSSSEETAKTLASRRDDSPAPLPGQGDPRLGTRPNAARPDSQS